MTTPRPLAELLAALGRAAPWDKAADWDPVGLQIGDPRDPVRRVAVCHEVTEAVVAAVEAEPVDLLVSYHPLLFRATTRLVAGATPQGRALRLARARAALAVVHTNFDVVEGGAADALADALELGDARGFAPLHGPQTHKLVTFAPAASADALLDAVARVGAGTIGNYTHCSYRSAGEGTFFAGDGTRPAIGEGGALNREPELRIEVIVGHARLDAVVGALLAAHPYEEPAYDVYDVGSNAGMVGRVGTATEGTTLADLAERTLHVLGHPALRVAGEPGRRLERVAVIPGAGGDLLAQAAGAGAEAVVTGDISHHRAREALDAGLSLLDPGHAPTERPGLERLFVSVAAQGVEVRSLLDLDPDPWGPGLRTAFL